MTVHSDIHAAAASRQLAANAFTSGEAVYFGEGRYQPQSAEGLRLIGHELTHVIQQRRGLSSATIGDATDAYELEADSGGVAFEAGFPMRISSPAGAAGTLQRQPFPGDGMLPPGDCPWGTYLPLRLSVESAKAVVSMMGACQPGDSCMFLATKIAAISAEIAARVALDATCFKGGDTGHRQQVQDKVNMLNRCYRFFEGSNCSPELVSRMETVVATARAAVEAAAIAAAAVVVVAAVAALIAAIIALAEFIAAALAAAAESVLVVEAIALLLALLTRLQPAIAGGP